MNDDLRAGPRLRSNWTVVDAFAAFILASGLWPLADPGHNLSDGPLVWLDVALHLTGAVMLAYRWKIVPQHRNGYWE